MLDSFGNSHDHSHSHGVSIVSPELDSVNNNSSQSQNNDFELKSSSVVGKNPRKEIKPALISKYKKVQSNGWFAFAGDILHKVADGFAIGACKQQIYVILLNQLLNSTIICM